MDRENVIKGLECCLTLDSHCGDCPYYSYEDIQELDCERNLRHDALALLKEDQKLLDLQHGALRGSSDMVELLFNKLDDQPQIVRCKDCKHILPKGFCHKHSRKVTDDWFCADVERRTDEPDRRVRVK